MVERIAVIGAGISGLSAALALQKQGHSVKVFEASSHVGGKIHSEMLADDPVEWGPQSLMSSHLEFDYLVEQAGVSEDIRFASEIASSRYVYRYGKINPIPKGLIQACASPLLGPFALLRVLCEPFIAKQGQRVSVHQFFSKRFGKSVANHFIDPFVSGVYSGHAQLLSARYAFPKIFNWEQEYGSVIKGLIKSKSKMKRHRIASFNGGLQTLVSGLAKQLIHGVQCSRKLKEFILEQDWIHLIFDGHQNEEVDRVVLAVGAHQLSRFIKKADASLSSVLQQLPMPPIAVVNVLMPTVSHSSRPRGFGVLLTSQEPLGQLLGVIMSSDIFPRQDGRELYTVFIGGRRFPEVAKWDEDQIKSMASTSLKKLLSLDASKAEMHTRLYQTGIPQYEGQQHLMKGLHDRFHQKFPQIRLVGHWDGGVSVLDAAQNARQLAENWLKE